MAWVWADEWAIIRTRGKSNAGQHAPSPWKPLSGVAAAVHIALIPSSPIPSPPPPAAAAAASSLDMVASRDSTKSTW